MDSGVPIISEHFPGWIFSQVVVILDDKSSLGGGFKNFLFEILFSPLLGEDFQIFFRWVETTN